MKIAGFELDVIPNDSLHGDINPPIISWHASLILPI